MNRLPNRGEIASVLGAVVAFGAGLAIYVATLRGARYSFLRSWFYEIGPGPNPPWYFMGQDWIDGLWAAGGLLLLSVFTVLAAPRLGAIVWAAFGMNAISFVTRIGSALNVWLHSERVWLRQEARSSWSSFEEYIQSQKTASDVSLFVAVAVVACFLFLYARALKREGSRAAVPPG